jgi:lipopolysaccharide transport system permease protein
LFANLANLFRYRGLIQSLVARELKARYRGSVLGFFWSFINPLLLLLVYSFVFSTVIPNTTAGIQPYALFMFCGILPWTWFSASLTEAASSLISGGNLIKKVLFPAEILPIVSVLANMVNFFLGLFILVPCLIYYHRLYFTFDLLWFPVTVLVHFRDIRDLLSNLLMLWFFATPIIYSWRQENVQRYKFLFDLNPLTHIAISYQEILFFGPVGHWKWLLALGAASIAWFVAGYWLFDRLRDSFAEAV